MSDLNVVEALQEQGRESREQFGQVRAAMAKMANSISELTTTLARVEERHARHDDAMRRIGKQVDDHEARLRTLELNKHAVGGGWRVVVAIASVIGMSAAVAATLIAPTLAS